MRPSFPLDESKLRDDLPRYPPLIQLIRVTSTLVSGPSGVAQIAGSSVLAPILHVAFTQQLRTDSLLPRDREPCLADDVRGLGLNPGFYLGRLAGSWNNLPVYEVITENTATSSTYTTNVGDGSSTSFTITHNLATRNIIVQVYEANPPYTLVYCTVEATTANSVTLIFNTVPSFHQYQVVVTTGGSGGGGGTCCITPPTSSTNNAIVLWSGTSGNSVSNSSIIVDGSSNVTGINNITLNKVNVTQPLSGYYLSIIVNNNVAFGSNLTLTISITANQTLVISDFLVAISNLSITNNTFVYVNGSGTMTTSTITSLGVSLLGGSTTGAMQTTLGLGTIATQNANNVSITGGSITGITDLAIADGGTGASSASSARSNLGLAIGSDIQAYSATLSALGGLSMNANYLPYFTGASTAGTSSFTSLAQSLLADSTTSAMQSTLGISNGIWTTGSLTATGSVQGDAAAITVSAVTVTSADGTKGVILPTAPPGIVAVYNNSASNLKVYPQSGSKISLTGTTNSAYVQPGNSAYMYIYISSTLWVTTVALT